MPWGSSPPVRLPRGMSAVRIGEAAGALSAGVEDPGLADLLSRIQARRIRSGNRVTVFFEGEAAFDAMLRDIDRSATEVLLESYILKDDAVGQRFEQALGAAAARGASVRVLTDAFGSVGTSSEFWRRLEAAGIAVRLYHPFGGPIKLLTFRDHRKILVVDRRVAYTGGMNIGEEYGSSVLPRERVFRDTHARVEGPTAAEMADVFRGAWVAAGGGRFDVAAPGDGDGTGARILVLDSRPGRGAREVSAALAAIAGAARRRLWMTVAYFAPRPRVGRVLGRAVSRGVDVRLLLPGRTDVRLVRHAGHGFFARLLERGVRIFEYSPAVLHAKTIVVDGCVSVIGSSNLDFRSFERNAECNFAIFDAEVGAAMERRFEEDAREASEIIRRDWRRRPFLHRLGDAAARRLAPLL
jgi:cardiolipin synthase A/B